MDSNGNSPSSGSLANLAHDLRQPLSNIALSASYIEMILEPEQNRVRDQIEIILQQVERASAALDRALEQTGVQMEPASENLFLRKVQTAVEA